MGIRTAKSVGRTSKVRRLLEGQRVSLQAIMAYRKLSGVDSDQGEALFLRGLASLMDGSGVNSLTPNDLRAIADRLNDASHG